MELRLGPGQQRGKTTLTTAFFGLACSWCISMSCSGLALWTRLSTLNQPLDGVRGSSESETQQTWNWKLQCEVPLATTRGNFVPTDCFYRETLSQGYMTATVWWWLSLNTCRQRTWHLLETLHIFGRSSPRSQCSVHSPSHDCPIFPYRKIKSRFCEHFRFFWVTKWGKKREENPVFEPLLGRADINGSLQLLFSVVLKVHELRLPQDEPAHLPVAARQRGHPSSFLVEPAGFDGVLLGPKPHEGLILQDTPATPPRDHETAWERETERMFIYVVAPTNTQTCIIGRQRTQYMKNNICQKYTVKSRHK